MTYHFNVESIVRVCDVITINCPLHPETEHLFNDALIGKMKRGAYIVNTARGKILRPRRNCAGARERPACRLRRRRLVPAASAAGSPLADDAAPWYDAAYLRDESIGTGALRRRGARNPGVLVQRSSHPRGVLDRSRRQAGWGGCAFLQRWERHWWLGGRGTVQEMIGRSKRAGSGLVVFVRPRVL